MILPFLSDVVRCICTVGFSVRLLSRRETGPCWSDSIEGPQRQWWDWNIVVQREIKSWNSLAWYKKAESDFTCEYINIPGREWKCGSCTQRTLPDSPRGPWNYVKTGHFYNCYWLCCCCYYCYYSKTDWALELVKSICGPHFWRYFKLSKAWLWANFRSWPRSRTGSALGTLQIWLPASVNPWFCENWYVNFNVPLIIFIFYFNCWLWKYY